MKPKDGLTLLSQIESEQLLTELIDQFNKDAHLSGIHQQIKSTLDISVLLRQVHRFLMELMTKDFGAYVSFLYRVDVTERTLREIDDIDPERIAEKVAFLVLQREWLKVSFRNKTR
ncbi:hypothetical protein [Lutimonas sp.]|uniref:hypothetical protein n=1 Tax=Lutimonas sp. TaxID=1872403 RepID=UPI003D9B99CC